jgi:predicted O-methyltransferase YrrM
MTAPPLSAGSFAAPAITVPPLAAKAQRVADRAGYELSSEPSTGSLLRTLAAAKPGGRLLEVGCGVGVGSAWLLDGMDAAARLTGIERHPKVAHVCRTLLAGDERMEVVNADAVEWLTAYDGPPFDLMFVDTTSAKFERRDLLFPHMADGALFIADDLLPQEKWTERHGPRVERFRREIFQEPDLLPTLIDWASGLVVAAYRKPR